MASHRFACPCCDHLVLEARGDYEICPVCGWEDDGLDPAQLDEHSGANRMSPRQGRDNFASIGACDERMLGQVLPLEERSRYAPAGR